MSSNQYFSTKKKINDFTNESIKLRKNGGNIEKLTNIIIEQILIDIRSSQKIHEEELVEFKKEFNFLKTKL